MPEHEPLPAYETPEGEPLATEAEAAEALRRDGREHLPETPDRESERTEAERDAMGGRMATAFDLRGCTTKDNLCRTALKNAVKRDEIPKHIGEAVWEKNRVISQYIVSLKNDPRRASFKPEEARTQGRQHFSRYLSQINEMLARSTREGLVTYFPQNKFAKLVNRTGYADEWVKELSSMLEEIQKLGSSTPEIEQMQGYISDVRALFQSVMDGDPQSTQARHFTTQQGRKAGPAEKRAAGALRMAGFMAATGMAIFSSYLTFKVPGSSPVYSGVWLGLAALSGGMLKGQRAEVAKNLSFLPTSEWETIAERLGLTGEGGNEIIRRIRLGIKKPKTSESRSARDLLSQLRDGHMPENERENVRRKFIAKMTGATIVEGKEPEGDNAELAKRLLALSSGQLVFFCDSVLNVTNPSAKAVLAYLVEHGVSSHSVAADMRSALTPPSASAPEETPPEGPLPV